MFVLIFNVVLVVFWVMLIITTIVYMCRKEIDLSDGTMGLLFSIFWAFMGIYLIASSIENIRNKTINDYKSDKYIEVVEYKYKTVDHVKTIVDSTYTYKLK